MHAYGFLGIPLNTIQSVQNISAENSDTRESPKRKNILKLLFSFLLLYLTRKLSWKMFKKMHREKVNIWLGSVSI